MVGRVFAKKVGIYVKSCVDIDVANKIDIGVS
jgi:hypothetical protein